MDAKYMWVTSLINTLQMISSGCLHCNKWAFFIFATFLKNSCKPP